MQYSGDVTALKLVHLTGSVTCNKRNFSYWGCSTGTRDLRILVTNGSNAVIFPQNSRTTRYQLPGILSNSIELKFKNLTLPLRVSSGQDFRVWYDEDLADDSEGDNGGNTCVDIYAFFV